MATSAEEVLPKRVTPLVRLVGQLHITHLAHVAVHVEVFLHGNHSYGFLGALHRRDSLTTTRAFGRKDPVKVVNAVDFVVKVHSEGDAVQAVVTHTAAEAARVKSFAECLEDALHDEVAADLALLRSLLESRVEVVLLAVDLPVHVVEGLASESSAAAAAHEAGSVVQIAHSLK